MAPEDRPPPTQPAKLVKIGYRSWETPCGAVTVSASVRSHPPMVRGSGGVKVTTYTAHPATGPDRDAFARERSHYSIRCRVAEWLAQHGPGTREQADPEAPTEVTATPPGDTK